MPEMLRDAFILAVSRCTGRPSSAEIGRSLPKLARVLPHLPDRSQLGPDRARWGRLRLQPGQIQSTPATIGRTWYTETPAQILAVSSNSGWVGPALGWRRPNRGLLRAATRLGFAQVWVDFGQHFGVAWAKFGLPWAKSEGSSKLGVATAKVWADSTTSGSAQPECSSVRPTLDRFRPKQRRVGFDSM